MFDAKYALLIVGNCADDHRELECAGARTFLGALPDLVAKDQLGFWREWLGSIRWAELSERSRMVLVTEPSTSADVTDGQNERLSARVLDWHVALALVSGNARPFTQPYLLTGAASGGDLRTVANFSSPSPLKRPFYCSLAELWLGADAEVRPFQEHLDQWCEAVRLLAANPVGPLVAHGLRSLVHAFSQPSLEFRIPAFVRAAETVLALPKKNGGATKFAERAATVLGTKPHPVLEGCAVADLAKDLFELRNECVHGKLPFEKAMEGGTPAVAAARLEALAERIAQTALWTALRSHEAFLCSRTELEKAWLEGRFPPQAQQP